jgi:putative transposase
MAPDVPTTVASVGEAFRPPATSLPPWLPSRKANRLPLDAYREPGTFFVTLATANRRPWFTSKPIVEPCADALRHTCETRSFSLVAYCFMPDHLHFLATTEVENDLVRLVKDFKQKTGYWFRNRHAAGGLKASPTTAAAQALWQRSYYDHVLRREEDIATVVRYIMENPVRAELVDSYDQFPNSWSLHALA